MAAEAFGIRLQSRVRSSTLLHDEYSPWCGDSSFFCSSSPIESPSFLDFQSSVPLSRFRWFLFGAFLSEETSESHLCTLGRACGVVILLWVSSWAGVLFRV
jgi:hypothetical protein